jgi:hypothetical protein
MKRRLILGRPTAIPETPTGATASAVSADRALTTHPDSGRLPRNQQRQCVRLHRLPAKMADFIAFPPEARAVVLVTTVSKPHVITVVAGNSAALLHRVVAETTVSKLLVVIVAVGNTVPLPRREVGPDTIVLWPRVATAEAEGSAALLHLVAAVVDHVAMAAEAANLAVAPMEKAGATDLTPSRYKSIFPRPGTVSFLSGLFFYVQTPSLHLASGG